MSLGAPRGAVPSGHYRPAGGGWPFPTIAARVAFMTAWRARVGPEQRRAGIAGRGRTLAAAAVLLLGLGAAPRAQTPSDAELQQLESLALLLGRAIGCALDTERAAGQIRLWFDQTFPPGSEARQRYLQVFQDTVRGYAWQQQSGNSPDSCAEVSDALATMGWLTRRTSARSPLSPTSLR
jgi:hypothetical protein